MILVTGATGLVGGHLLAHLLEHNDRVKAIKRPESSTSGLRTILSFYAGDNADGLLNRIDWVEADLLNADSLSNALKGVDCVYHCAAVVSFGGDEQLLLQTNYTGTLNMVTASELEGVKSFCYVSSIAACGSESDGSPVHEFSPFYATLHLSAYAQSKYKAEACVWEAIQRGFPAFIVNPGVILGVSGNAAGSALLFEQVRKGLIFYTNGGSGYVDVRDVVRIMIQFTETHVTGKRFILVAENCSNRDVLTMMATGFNLRPPFICVGKTLLLVAGFLSEYYARLTHKKPLFDRATARTATGRKYYDSSRVKMLLNYHFISVHQSIQDVCSFMQKQRTGA